MTVMLGNYVILENNYSPHQTSRWNHNSSAYVFIDSIIILEHLE